MREKKLCTFYLGSRVAVRLYATDEGDGGSAASPYDSGTMAWEIRVGVGRSWIETLACFLHECEEAFLLAAGVGYNETLRWAKKSPDRKFLLDHMVLEEMNICVADVLNYAEPILKKAWREFHAKKKRKKKAGRKKKK